MQAELFKALRPANRLLLRLITVAISSQFAIHAGLVYGVAVVRRLMGGLLASPLRF
jgi:hypothetical protein